MVNNSSKLNLCFDTRIITFPSKENGEFDQPNSLVLSLPVTYNRYLTKLSVVKSIHFPFLHLLFPISCYFLTIICFDCDEFGSFLAGFGWFWVVFCWIRVVSGGFGWFRVGSDGFRWFHVLSITTSQYKPATN